MHLHSHIQQPLIRTKPRRAIARRTLAILVVCGLLYSSFLSPRAHHAAPPRPHNLTAALPPTGHDPATIPSTRVVARRPNTVLVAITHGGVGNQLYFLLEALVLARHAHLDLLLPSLPSREFSKTTTERTLEEHGVKYWHLGRMQPAVAPHARILSHFPHVCAGSFDYVYIFTRAKKPDKVPPAKVSSRTKQVLQFLLCPHDGITPKNQDECAKHAFANAAVERRYMQLSHPPDMSLVNELVTLRDRQMLPAAGRDMSRPACVLVDGHTFPHGGRVGHEYLYSFMHYVEPVTRIANMAASWNVKELTVLHLRYDEKECMPRPGTEGKVCIRLLMAINQPDTVYWAPMPDLVDVVVKLMAAEQTPALFLAASPYVPEETVRQLREAFGKRVRLAPPVKQSLLHNDQNFVERELAVRCGCFIGDFASTWSGTVYYKRRTLGLKTHWTSVLLEKSKTLGYYAEEERIPRPEELEAKFAVAGI